MATYKIESIQTRYFIISDGTEKDGDPVTTVDGSVCVPSDTALTFSSSLGAAIVQTTIQGKANLYTAPAEDGSSVLVWSSDNYTWQAGRTAGGTYEIYPASGANLYWFQNSSTEPHVSLLPGSSAQESEIFFIIS